MAQQLANVGDAVFDHRGTFQRQTPAENTHALTVTSVSDGVNIWQEDSYAREAH